MAERGDNEEYNNQYGPDQGYGGQHGRDIDQGYGGQHGRDTDQGYGGQHGRDIDQGYGGQHGQDIDQGYGDQHGQDIDQGYGDQHGRDTDQGYGGQHGRDTDHGYGDQHGRDIDQGYGDQDGQDTDQEYGGQHGQDIDQEYGDQHGRDTDQGYGDQQLQLRRTQIRTIRLAPGVLVQLQQNRRTLFVINDVEHYPQRKQAEEQKQEPIQVWWCVTSVILLAILIPLGYFIPSLPAHMVLPFDEVNPVNMLCRPRTKMEVYQNLSISKKQSHRTVCTFNIFHYDLLDRNKTYFALDIDINIAKAVGKLGKLVTMKLFHLNEKSKTFHKQRNMYWSISLCAIKDEMALCLDDVYYRRESVITTKVLSTVGMDEKKVVSFLFLVDNSDQLMHVYSPIVLWKDVVFLKHYYEGQTLSLWISLTDRKLEDSISARIRSGPSVTIGDLPNPGIATNYDIIKGTLTYPFRCIYHYIWSNPKPVSVENAEETDIE